MKKVMRIGLDDGDNYVGQCGSQRKIAYRLR